MSHQPPREALSTGIARGAVALVLLALGGCDRDDLDYAVGTIERYRIELVADSNQPIVALHVIEGDRVVPGQP